jgi:tRNA (guanine37-N1)-methyltransferase
MRIDILTLLPELLEGPFSHSIIKRAITKQLLEIQLHNIRDYSTNKHKQVDDYAFGGGAGMVMMIEPIEKLINQLKSERKYDEVIYMTPDGQRFNQQIANRFSIKKNLIILCGHYKGVDQRIREHLITSEISIGDYVLTGGELAAAVITDSIARLIPGVISDETSALTDSFQDGLLAPPVYTRPADYKGWKVPEILLSGNEKLILEWRHEQSVIRTKERRPDLLNDMDD